MTNSSKAVPTHRDDAISPKDSDVFLANAALDNVTSVVIALGSEFWALQKRLNVVELLLAKNGAVSNEMIESYRPSKEQETAWEDQRDRFIKRVYGFLQNIEPRPKKSG